MDTLKSYLVATSVALVGAGSAIVLHTAVNQYFAERRAKQIVEQIKANETNGESS